MEKFFSLVSLVNIPNLQVVALST